MYGAFNDVFRSTLTNFRKNDVSQEIPRDEYFKRYLTAILCISVFGWLSLLLAESYLPKYTCDFAATLPSWSTHAYYKLTKYHKNFDIIYRVTTSKKQALLKGAWFLEVVTRFIMSGFL